MTSIHVISIDRGGGGGGGRWGLGGWGWGGGVRWTDGGEGGASLSNGSLDADGTGELEPEILFDHC